MPKKILLVTRPIAPPWDEASKNFAYFIAKNMQGLEVSLMTKGFLPDMPASVKQHPVYTTSEIARFNLEQKIRSLYFQFKNREKFDINHYFFTPTRLNSFLIKNFLKSGKTKLIQTVATLREDLWSDADLPKLLFADLIITYSDYAKNKLNSLGFNNVKRVYPGIDLNYYSPAPKDPKAMDEFGIAQNDFVVTYPGEYVRLGATDDILNLILQYSRILKDKNIKIIFACRIKNSQDIGKKEEVMKKIASRGLSASVIFINTYPDMAKLYNLTDAVIFPVRDMKGKFDVPLAAIEPMACEKPVIISDLSILQEFAKPEHSVIIERGNVAQLKEAILNLHANPEKRTAIGKNARKFAEVNFDIKKTAEIYRQIYEKL